MQTIVATKPPKVYIETSVWGMILPDQPRALREPTLRFLSQCRAGLFIPYVSVTVLGEIRRAALHEVEQMLAEVNRLEPIAFESDGETEHLAKEYIKARVVSAKKLDDARHVAIATVNHVDILVSWNHRHLVNDRKKELFDAVNCLAGYESPSICTPLEVSR